MSINERGGGKIKRGADRCWAHIPSRQAHVKMQQTFPHFHTRKIALMSIKPQFWELIAEGSKRYELRRTSVLLEQGDLVVVYASSPAKALVGCFDVEEVLRESKSCVWDRYGPDLGVTRSGFREYFDGAKLATAIKIGAPRTFARIPLAHLRRTIPDFRPPQSFMYWQDEVLRSLKLGEQITLLHPPMENQPRNEGD